MKQKLLNLAAALLLCSASASAQTDVTSTYITNAGFDESSDFQTGNVATGGSNQRKAVTGWTNTGGDTYTTGAAIGFGTSGQINGANLPSTNSDGATTGGALCLNAAWQSQVWYAQNVTLPAGNYTMTFKVNNVGQNNGFEKDPVMFSFTTTDGSSFSGNVHSYPANTWTTQTITFALAAETTGSIKIGYKATNTGSGNTPKLVVDYVKAMYNSNYTATLQSAIDRATILNARASDSELTAAISAAQGVLDVADNTVAYQETINSAVTTLRSAISTAASKVVLLEGENITFMFENADFESSTPVTGGITTYDYDAATNGTSFSRMQVVEGWTIVANGNAKSAGVYQFNSGAWLGSVGSQYQAPSSGSATGEEKALGIVAVWQSSAQYKQDCTLPAGSYIIEVPIYNTAGTTAFTKNLIGFVENGGTEHLATAKTYATGSWITEKIIFELANETAGYLSLGYTAANQGSGAMPHLFIDGVKVTYTSPIAAAYQRYQDALQAAQDAINNSDYANVTGSEKMALQAAIDATPASTKEGYNAAADDLDAAVATFTAAAPAYNAIADLNNRAMTAGVASYVITTETTAAIINADIPAFENTIRVAEHAPEVQMFNQMLVDYPYEIALGEWATSGDVKDQSSQHWNGDANATYNEPNSWGSNTGGTSSWTQEITLPAGYYMLQIAGRHSNDSELSVSVKDGENVLATTSDFPAQGTGYGIDMDGNANYDMNGNFANSGNGWGWAWRSLDISLGEEKTITIVVDYSATVGQQWASFTSYVIRSQFPKEKIDLLNAIKAAQAVDLTANVGTGVFQKNFVDDGTLSSAITTAQEVYDNAYATTETVNDAITTLNNTKDNVVADYEGAELNAPADGQLFNIILTYDGWTYDGKAITFIAGGNPTAGNYAIQYKEAPNTNLAQAFTFTKVSGNGYKLSQIDADGNARYICTGVQYGGNTAQIRTTTNADEALVVTIIPTATEGVYNLRNTEANEFIGSQDAGVFTVNSHIDFNIVETTKPSIAINTTEAGWGTLMLPFSGLELPAGVTAYSVSELSGDRLTLEDAGSVLLANMPYIIEGAWEENVTGDAQGTELTKTDGLLTGTYEAMNAIDGTYILQKQDETVGFFQVDTNEATPRIRANRAYLTAPSSGVKAFFLGGDADAIQSVFTKVAAGEIYDLAGRKVQKMQKGGVYIIDGKKVSVK